MTGLEDEFAPTNSEPIKVPTYLWNYAQDHQELALAAEDLKRFLQEVALSASIQIHTIEARAKSLSSFRDKAQKVNPEGYLKYPNPGTEIRDCVAARIIVFTKSARDRLADLIDSQTSIIERSNPGNFKKNGYDSEHLIVADIKDRSVRLRYGSLSRFLDRYPGLEIQIRSVAAHAWAEYEHDTRYKSAEAFQALSEADQRQIDQWFVEAGGLRRFMDELFNKVEAILLAGSETESSAGPLTDAVDPDTEEMDDRNPNPLNEDSLTSFIAERFPNVEPGDAAEIAELLEHTGRVDLTSINQLRAALADLQVGQVARLMDYPRKTSGARHLDDELLAALRDDYVSTAVDEGRKRKLELRLLRVRGKISIYSISLNGRTSAPMPGARAVRELARIVANADGIRGALVDGVVSDSEGLLLPSTFARPVRTNNGTLHVATNFTRAAAEAVMQTLAGRVAGGDLKVMRAGDVVVENSRPLE